MLETALTSSVLIGMLMVNPTPAILKEAGFSALPKTTVDQKQVLSQKFMDLTNRFPDIFVNEVFSDNIILNLHYLKGDVGNIQKNDVNINGYQGNVVIDWEKARKPFGFTIELKPGLTFAYHDSILSEFKNTPLIYGSSHYSIAEGYKSDGYLAGDGVCHLASLFHWVASEAGLTSLAKVNHDFMKITGIPKEYGVSIYSIPNSGYTSEAQNLYITNPFSYPVTFTVRVENNLVGLTISK